jgi:transcriptional regulator with XRE-family HTH domain
MTVQTRPGRNGRPDGSPGRTSFAGRLGRRLREERKSRGLTLEEVAVLSGGQITASMLSGYEFGKTEPRLSKFLAVCLALSRHPMEILPKDVQKLFKAGALGDDAVRLLSREDL